MITKVAVVQTDMITDVQTDMVLEEFCFVSNFSREVGVAIQTLLMAGKGSSVTP